MRDYSWPGWCLALGALTAPALLHCAPPGVVTAAPEVPSASVPRRPDGVVLDPPAAMPAALERAPARGVVALREPAGDVETRKAVLAYVRAFVREDLQALERMLTADAKQLFSHGAGSSSTLIDFWRQRLRTFDYSRLASVEIVRPELIERYEYDELGEAGERPRPPEMRAGDVLVRCPVTTPRVNGERLFGDVIVLLLRWDEGRSREDRSYRIAGFSEEDAP